MKPGRSPSCTARRTTTRRSAAVVRRVSLAVSVFIALSGCEQNSFVPPPKVDVAVPARRAITRDFDATDDTAQTNLQQAQVYTEIAQGNYGYTNVVAPFDGIIGAHLVSFGELVGVASPTQLAAIVQLDLIYVSFNVKEQQVLRIRC